MKFSIYLNRRVFVMLPIISCNCCLVHENNVSYPWLASGQSARMGSPGQIMQLRSSLHYIKI